VLWGVFVGALQAATPLAFWWLNSATVYALGLIVIASVYIGFAVADHAGHDQWAGMDSNHRPDDYESPALTN
jgi:hypothetical protein